MFSKFWLFSNHRLHSSIWFDFWPTFFWKNWHLIIKIINSIFNILTRIVDLVALLRCLELRLFFLDFSWKVGNFVCEIWVRMIWSIENIISRTRLVFEILGKVLKFDLYTNWGFLATPQHRSYSLAEFHSSSLNPLTFSNFEIFSRTLSI